METTNKETDAQLEKYGISIKKLKGDFALLFPETAKSLPAQTYDATTAAAEGLWLGFKAGVVWGCKMDLEG